MLVSIITPCFNSEKTIRDTIEAVLHQTYKNIEYIIVDGGSTDGTLKIIREYQPFFQGRMQYVSEADKGIYSAMNKGIRMSHGKLIGILNSDDYYELDAVENIVGNMNDEQYQVIYGYCRVWYNGCKREILKKSHNYLKQGMIPHPTCFVTRAVYRDFGLFLTAFRIAGDYEFMLRLYCSGKVSFTQVKAIIANFRIGGVSCNGMRAEKETVIIRYCYKKISFTDMIRVLI